MKIDSDIPDSVAVGKPSQEFTVDAVATVGANVTQWLTTIGVKTIEGTADAKAQVAAPEGEFSFVVPFHMAGTGIPASGPFEVEATADAPTQTFSRPGKARITAGDLTLHLALKDTTGDLALQAATDVPCTLDAGQSNAVASFDITAPASAPTPTAGSVASPVPRPTAGSAASAVPEPTTDSVASAVPGPMTPVRAGSAAAGATTSLSPGTTEAGNTPVADPADPTPGSTSSTIISETSTGGADTRDLTLLAVVVLAAATAAFCLGRWLNHRPVGNGGGGDRRTAAPEAVHQDVGARVGNGAGECPDSSDGVDDLAGLSGIEAGGRGPEKADGELACVGVPAGGR